MGAGLMLLKLRSKVDVAAIHHIEGPWLQDQDFQHIDLVHLAVADVGESHRVLKRLQTLRVY